MAGLPVWPQIYLCVRCGGMGDASDVALGAATARENGDCSPEGTVLLILLNIVIWAKSRQNYRPTRGQVSMAVVAPIILFVHVYIH